MTLDPLRRAPAFVLVALLVATPVPAGARAPAIRLEAKADRTAITLAQSVRVALTIEGPAPLLVELPKSLLTADADAAWRIRPDPPDARAEPKPAEPGRWQRVYRLDPYAEGQPLVASFNPVTVNGQVMSWEPVKITVTRTVGDATTPPRPPIGPEDPPPAADPPTPPPFPVWAAVLAGSACVVVLVAVRFRSGRVKPVPSGAWALAQLAQLPAGSGAATVERVAAILRAFVEGRFGLPAPKLTTEELAAAARVQGWPVEQAEALRALLDECDRVKFARDVPDDDGCRRLVRGAADWVNHVGRPPDPR
jgi:hypothetical protein